MAVMTTYYNIYDYKYFHTGGGVTISVAPSLESLGISSVGRAAFL